MAIKELIHRRLFMGGAALSLLALAGAATTLATQSTSAQTPPTPSTANGTTATSNEDPAHEAGETPEQEAAENNGTARHGGKGSGSNEDAAHEANESPEKEAAEHAARGTNPAPVKPSSGSTTPAQ